MDDNQRQEDVETARLRICLDAANADIRQLKTIIRDAIVILETSNTGGKAKGAALEELFKSLDVHTRQPERG